jgi:glycosyltransferase involved in cell wall biosynthesis
MQILHVFRSPLGGLFRHVRDLARAQSEMGHQVALVCDSTTGGPSAEKLLEETRAHCAGGILRMPVGRLPGPGDIAAIAKTTSFAKGFKANIIHGHGAKGGLLARVAARRLGVPGLYTPHGGSMHYQWKSPVGAAFLATEKALARMGAGCVFVCNFEKDIFERKIGLGGKPSVVAYNGLWPDEFAEVPPGPKATDLVFVGEVRVLKGVDLLLQALTRIKPRFTPSLTIVGDGPEMDSFKAESEKLGLAQQVTFAGRMPMARALPLGHIMVIPSRNESFPYVVLETVAAAKPLLATHVGGIPEVLPPDMLCAPTAQSIADGLTRYLQDPAAQLEKARTLAQGLKINFSAQRMAKTITDFYATL